MATQENNQSLNYELLIAREIQLIKQGSSAQHLSNLFKQYEFLPTRTTAFTNNSVSMYLTSLILSHKFIQLKFALVRNKSLVRPEANEMYKNISNEGINQNFSQLLSHCKMLQKLNECDLSPLLVHSIKSYILQCLSKNYTTFPFQFLKKQYEIGNDDIIQNGYTIQGNFVVLKQLKTHTGGNNLGELMQQRVRQLSSITQNIIKR